MAIGAKVLLFEHASRTRVRGIEPEQLLVDLDRPLLPPVGLLDELRRLAKKLDLLAARPVLRRRDVHLGELAEFARLREKSVESLEGRLMRGQRHEDALEVVSRDERVAEDVREEHGGFEKELRDHRRGEHLRAAPLRVRLVGERELAHALVAYGRLVELCPRLRGELSLRERRHERVENFFLALQLRFEAG